MKEKNIILAARTISIVFTPFYLPVLGLVALFMLSYLNRLVPWYYKLTVIMMVYLFTVLLPTLLIHLYRKYQGWTLHELGMKERRMVPYIISIVCYFACYYIMNLYHIPHFISSILITALAIQIICALINVWWKISTHSAAIGGVTGALMSFALLFQFNPTWWLCLAILFAGLVGSSRIILKQHTLSQVNVGFIVGLISAFYIISMI
ncbi:hypothetical protein [Hoylesella buccalis]|uniref:phosphatase PAP2 family protein n=1 Tax=Hoylesella buccalis TaxID=28127 RepID=UPI0026EFC8F2|nr:hypothetical protein [Hoylesella buccalis]